MDGEKSAYEAWMEEQIELAKAVRRYQWQTAGAFAAALAAIILMASAFCWLVSRWVPSAWVGLQAIACLALALFALELGSQRPGLTLESYRRRNRRALKAMTAEEREEFARDQLEAFQDPVRCLEDEADEAPFRFTLGRQYVCMTGGRGYGPRIVKLSQVLRARPLPRRGSFPFLDKALGQIFPEGQGLEQFAICFERRSHAKKPRQTLMVFETEASRKEALAMLRFHFDGEVWRKPDSPGPSLRIVK